MRLARWQSALAVVLTRWASSGLALTDRRALEAYAALERGLWLEALLWLGEGPVVEREAALSDPLGSLLAAIVLRVVGPLVGRYGVGRGSPWWRAVALAYWQAITRRPVRDPTTWAVEALLRAGGRGAEVREVEALLGEDLAPERVDELVAMHARDWEREALERLLAWRREPREDA